jgi:organic radical activating enzyme
MLADSVESWESVGEDPMVRDLAVRMASRSGGRSPKDFMTKLNYMARVISAPGVLAVAREPLDEKELLYSAVLQRVRVYADEHTPRWTLCTGGATSLEISPNGFYGRCPKTGAKREYMGDIRDEGPLKVFDPERDDLTCTIPCKKMMCFRNNVIRGTDDADFADKMDQEGLRGNYNPSQRGYHSNIFIRWKVTDVCNYTCAYCCDWRTVNAKGMEATDDEMMAAAGRMVSQFDAISMRLTGGEPSSRRRYVDLMRLFHDNLDRFSDIEIRTNLSYQAKHKEVLNWDWDDKLHLHIGCHIRDKNFTPWRMVEVLQEAPKANYVLKFVSLPAIRHHVQFFRRYFVDNGIPSKNIKIVEENSGREDVYHQIELEEAPKARKVLEERAKSAAPDADTQAETAMPNPAGDAPAETANPQNAPAKQAHRNGSANGAATRLTITDLRAMAQRNAERQAIPS